MGKKIKITKNWTLNICIAADISESIGDEDLTHYKGEKNNTFPLDYNRTYKDITGRGGEVLPSLYQKENITNVSHLHSAEFA